MLSCEGLYLIITSVLDIANCNLTAAIPFC